MSDEMPIYPRGAIAMDSGDLIQVTNFKVSQKKNGTKILHTLRVEGSGIVIGNEETEVSFDYNVPETGQERDYLSLVRKGKIKKLRVKIPGETFAVVGVCSGRELEVPHDDAIKSSISFMGKTVV
jgi:hypothetical protein